MAEESMELKKELQRLATNIVDDDDCEMEVVDEAIQTLKALRAVKLSASAAPEAGESSGSSLVVPQVFRCPISGELMKDPVLLETGQTYDRPFIERWFHKGHDTCPQTKTVLSSLVLIPNHLVRKMISKWCVENGLEPPNVVYEEVVKNADINDLNELLERISSSSLSDQKEAAKQLRWLTKWDHSFRAHFAKLGLSVQRLLHPLTLYDSISCHPDLQEDIITTVLNLSIHDDNKRVAEEPLVLPMLIKSLEYGTVETKANAAMALFSLSSLDRNKFIIGDAGALKPLIALIEEGHPVIIKDAAAAIFSLCLLHENQRKASCDGGVGVILRNIMDDILVDELVSLLALLSIDLTAVDEMCKLRTVSCVLRILRETDVERIKENCITILYAICKKDPEKLREIQYDENEHRTILRLSGSENLRVKKKAARIREMLLCRTFSQTYTA